MKPILFNTDMVKAILDGRKTVTRRLVKSKNKLNRIEHYNGGYQGRYFMGNLIDGMPKEFTEMVHPHYKFGDILYVRETWQNGSFLEDDKGKAMDYIYKADDTKKYNSYSDWGIKWHPSIHMPKEAARIFLRVKDVRVERLQDITEEQAKSEGIRGYSKDGELFKYAVTDDWWYEYHQKHRKKFRGTYWQDMPRTAKEAFSYLWNSTIKKYDYGSFWTGNPWVWVIEFERISKEEAYAEGN